MWIVTGIMSMIFCIIGWGMASKRNKIADWASVGSLSFVAVTLLMEYRMILNWVNKEDWMWFRLCFRSCVVMWLLCFSRMPG